MSRGEVVLFEWPYTDGTGRKLRPAVVVQADFLHGILDDTILVQITSTRHGIPGTEVEIDPAVETASGLLITGGRVVDGTGNPWFAGDVAIKGDRIAAVGRVKGTAKRTIDAKGKVVAPGFIDVHSHSDYHLLEDGTAQSKIYQGVTTE